MLLESLAVTSDFTDGEVCKAFLLFVDWLYWDREAEWTAYILH